MLKNPPPSMSKLYDAYQDACNSDSGHGAYFKVALRMIFTSEWMVEFEKYSAFRDIARPFTLWDNSTMAWSIHRDVKREQQRIKPVEKLDHSWALPPEMLNKLKELWAID